MTQDEFDNLWLNFLFRLVQFVVIAGQRIDRLLSHVKLIRHLFLRLLERISSLSRFVQLPLMFRKLQANTAQMQLA